jgi:muramoyltetrapeptide carboxypeptidase LdcA involved in peptidoglycan recycling
MINRILRLRNYAAQGILEQASGIIMGMVRGITSGVNPAEYDQALLEVLEEENLSCMPVITGMDFGHTDPMFIIPYGAISEIDPINKKFIIKDNAVE